MSQREAYRAFCRSTPELPLFLHDWYLDAVCADEGEWGVAMAYKNPEVAGVFPYLLKRKGPWRYIAMPPLARMLGPWLRPEYRNARHEIQLIDELIDQLPKPLAAFEQDFHYGADNWLPFHWRGFRQTTRYSYVLHVDDLDAVYAGFNPDYKNLKIPKAAKQVAVSTEGSPEEFFHLQQLSYARQNMKVPFSYALFQRLDAALAERRQRAIFFTRDRNDGALHSAAYLVWDARSSYYLMAGDDPALRNSGAGILLAWEAMRYTNAVLHLPTFDFLGSMVRPIERVRRQFGAVQRPYFRVRKEWLTLWALGKRMGR